MLVLSTEVSLPSRASGKWCPSVMKWIEIMGNGGQEIRSGSNAYYRYYVYINGKKVPVYNDPDKQKWYILQKRLDNHRTAFFSNPSERQYILDTGMIKTERITFSDILNLKPSAQFIQQQNYAKRMLKELGLQYITPGAMAKIPNPMFEGGILQFSSVEHAKEFFKETLDYLSQSEDAKPLLPCYLALYDDLINNRFNKIDLTLNLNNLMPNSNGSNGKQIVVAKAFQKVMSYTHNILRAKYSKDSTLLLTAFPLLGKKTFTEWPPKQQNAFYNFYKANFGDKSFGDLRTSFLNEEVKLGLLDKLHISLSGLDFLSPAHRLAEVKRCVILMSDPVSDKEGLRKFYERCKKWRKKNKNLSLIMVPYLDGGRLLLINNDPKTEEMLKKSLKHYAWTQTHIDNAGKSNIKDMNTIVKGYESFDKIVIGGIHSTGLTKEVKLCLYGLYSYFTGIRDIADFEINNFTLWSFGALIYDFPGEMIELAKTILYSNDEAKVLMAICKFAGVIRGGGAGIKFVKWLATSKGVAWMRSVRIDLKNLIKLIPQFGFKPSFKAKPARVSVSPKAKAYAPKLSGSVSKAAKAPAGTWIRGAGGKILGFLGNTVEGGLRIVKSGPVAVGGTIVAMSLPAYAPSVSDDIYDKYRSTLLSNYKYNEKSFGKAYEFYKVVKFSDNFCKKYPLLNYANEHTEIAAYAEKYKLSVSEYENLIGIYIKLKHIEREKRFDFRIFSAEEFFEAYRWYKSIKGADFRNFENLLIIYGNLPKDFYINYIQRIKLDLESGEGKLRMMLVLKEIYNNIRSYGSFKKDKFIRKIKIKFKFFPGIKENRAPSNHNNIQDCRKCH